MDDDLTVHDSQLAAKWTDFLQDYYRQEIQRVALCYPEELSVVVAFKDIELRDPELADYLLQRPRDTLRVGEASLFAIDVTVENKPRLRLRIAGLPESAEVLVRDLRVSHLSRFTCLHGIVNRATPVRPQLLEAAFECRSCGNVVHVLQEEDRQTEPAMCEACEKSGNIWRLNDDLSRHINVQRIRLQEVPDDIKGSVQPEEIIVYLRDDLVHSVTIGDRVKINGVVVPETRRANQQKLTVQEKVFESNWVEPQARAFDEIPVSEEDQEKILEHSRRDDLIAWFQTNFAPSLHGVDNEKLVLVLSLFGGNRRIEPNGEIFVPDIHVLLCGDPSTGKSSLLHALRALSPRAVMVGGAMASKAGLAGGLVRDSFDKDGMTVEAGALQKAHLGHLLIDEFDKLEKEDQSAVLLAMSMGRVLLGKVGTTGHESPAECAVIGAANPKTGRFDDRDPIAPQINMRPEMLSRFAAVLVLLDKPNPERDEARLRHKRDRALRDAADPEHAQEREDQEIVDFMRKYIAYARRRPAPRETPEQWAVLEDAFRSLRSASLDHIIIDDRTLDNMRRFSQASAKLRLSDTVSAEDAEQAVALVMASLRSIAMDPRTGELNMDFITTTKHRIRSQDEDVQEVHQIIVRLSRENPKGWANEDEVAEAAEAAGVKPERIEFALRKLREAGKTYARGGGTTHAPLESGRHG